VTCDEVKVENGAMKQSCSQHHADEGNRIPYSFFGMICNVEESEQLLHFHKKRSCCFRQVLQRQKYRHSKPLFCDLSDKSKIASSTTKQVPQMNPSVLDPGMIE
jgi:hypothetical protein